MGTWTADPTGGVDITCEVEFDAGVWTDVSDFLDDSWSSFRGKQSERDELQPGTLTVRLDNSDRRFDPAYADGPYFGKLRPMKRLRITVAVGVFSASVFTGYVLGWAQQWGDFSSTATVQVVDANRLFNARLPESAYHAEVLADDPSNYWPLQAGDLSNAVDGGAPLVEAKEESDPITIDVGFPVGAGSMISDNGSTSFELGAPSSVLGGVLPAAVEMWLYDATGLLIEIGTASTNYMQFEFQSSPGLGFEYRHAADDVRWAAGLVGPPFVDVFDQTAHHLVMIRSGGNIIFMVDGSTWVTTALTSPGAGSDSSPEVKILGAGAIGHLALYDTAPSVDRFHAHYQAGKWARSGAHGIYGFEHGGARIGRVLDDVGFDSGLRDLDPGRTRQAPYLPAGQRAVEYLAQVEASEQGIVFVDVDGQVVFRDRNTLWTADPVITLADDGTGVDYAAGDPDGNSVDTIRNKVTATWRSGAVTRRDQASITEFGEIEETVESDTIHDPKDAGNLAAYRVRLKAEPGTVFPEVEIDMIPNPDTQIPAVLALELGDIVVMKRTPMSVGDPIEVRTQVLGIGHEVTPDQWTVTLYLSPAIPAATEVPYWILGDATYGRIGAAYGNKIPF